MLTKQKVYKKKTQVEDSIKVGNLKYTLKVENAQMSENKSKFVIDILVK